VVNYISKSRHGTLSSKKHGKQREYAANDKFEFTP
jgi:hypothetical protein